MEGVPDNPEGSPHPHAASHNADSVKILLIEENPEIIRQVRSTLVDYHVDIAHIFTEFFPLIVRNLYDVILIHIGQNVNGLNNLDTARGVRVHNEVDHRNRDTPFIALISSRSPYDISEILGHICEDYVHKPFNSYELRQKVERCVTESRRRRLMRSRWRTQ